MAVKDMSGKIGCRSDQHLCGRDALQWQYCHGNTVQGKCAEQVNEQGGLAIFPKQKGKLDLFPFEKVQGQAGNSNGQQQ